MSSDPFAALGDFLTAKEAVGLAAVLAAGELTSQALKEVNAVRREQVKALLAEAGLGHAEPELSIAVLSAIAGAKAVRNELSPVWTMPGNEAKIGHLTGEFHRLVEGARQSVTCATYNFEPTSTMWEVLKAASEQPGVVVTVYVDGSVGAPDQVKAQLPKANVYSSVVLPNGKQMKSHAKFVVIDHAVLLLTSANFSFSAEKLNLEFGLLVHDPALAESVESTMTSKHGSLYELT